jgi:hypothetical protein
MIATTGGKKTLSKPLNQALWLEAAGIAAKTPTMFWQRRWEHLSLSRGLPHKYTIEEG